MAKHPAEHPAEQPAHHQPAAAASGDEREAAARLARVNGPGELHAAILALLLTPGSQRERRAWREETKGLSSADALRQDVKTLGPALRLPWLEALLARLARAPLAERQALVEATRRVMTADGLVRPIDRLHWLLLRHRLGDAPATLHASGVGNDMAQLSLHTRREIARVTAFLSRLVPDASTPDRTRSEAWYHTVLQPWLSGQALPPCEPPDADGLAVALQELQALPWMLKPVLVRAWAEAAWHHKAPGPLGAEAADALRLACALLDSPMPPALARHYVEIT